MRVALVDDHCIVRYGLRSLLKRRVGVVVVGEAADRDAALSQIAAVTPDLVLLDLRLRNDESSGLDLLAEITTHHPDVAVVVLTTVFDERLVVEAVRRGARGYVLKDVEPDELVRILRTVAGGGSGFDARTAQVLASAVARRVAPGSALTDRERDVTRLVARGMSNGEIGAALFISESTVKFHVRNVMRKLAAARRTEVVSAAIRLGLA